MFCNKCGNRLPVDSAFCSRCGAPVAAAEEPEKSADTSSNATDCDISFDPYDVAENKVFGVLAYFGILFFIPLVVHPDSKYCRFHSNQGLLLLIFTAGLNIAFRILAAILKIVFSFIFFASPIYWIINLLLGLAVAAVTILLLICGIRNALSGKVEELPVIGKYRLIK